MILSSTAADVRQKNRGSARNQDRLHLHGWPLPGSMIKRPPKRVLICARFETTRMTGSKSERLIATGSTGSSSKDSMIPCYVNHMISYDVMTNHCMRFLNRFPTNQRDPPPATSEKSHWRACNLSAMRASIASAVARRKKGLCLRLVSKKQSNSQHWKKSVRKKP